MDGGGLIMQWTIWGALAAWWVTCIVRLSGRGLAAARWTWTAGCALLLAHVAAAFHFRHGWSHAAAYADTARQVAEHPWFGVEAGGGVYVNYAFCLLWVADAAWWWTAPRSYVQRSLAVELAIQAVFVFMIFFAAVVFAEGPVRWLTLLGFGALCFMAWRSRPRLQRLSR